MVPEGFYQYFIALVPPSPVREEGYALKEYFSQRYNSKASLNSPPHITLHMPFRIKKEKEEQLLQQLTFFNPSVTPFLISLQNFNAFTPRVIYIDVVMNHSLRQLKQDITTFCKQQLNVFNADYKDQAFNPHITLAFRDLKKAMFHEAWAEFRDRSYSAQFLADRFTLLRHNGKTWDEFREFPLKGT
jgi:2'-5' RNA ligase